MVQSEYATAEISLPAARAGGLTRISAADLTMMLVFALLISLQIAHHEMWRDEIHSWGLVLASSSLSDLFANLRYTGHPGLWYLLLWSASSVTDSPFTIQIVHAAISIVLVAVIALLSPFSRLEKLLLLSSYFVLYEYTVISRNYGIGMLLALIYAQCRATQPERLYLNGLLLGLLANTNLFGLVLSAAFAGELALDMLLRRGGNLRAVVGPLLRAAVFYLPLAVLAAATIWPASDISWRSTGEPFRETWDLARLAVILSQNVAAMLPVHALDYWIFAPPAPPSAEGGLSLNTPVVLLSAVPFLVIAYLHIFKDNRRLLLIPALTLIGSLAVGQIVYSGFMRHWGINFVAFVAALWIQRAWTPSRSPAAIALLGISAVAGIAISIQQAQLTFSQAGPTARWIREHGLENNALIATPDTMVAPIAVYLGKPAYYLDCSCIDNYMFYHNRRDPFRESEIPARMARALKELQGTPSLFVTSDRLTAAQLNEMRRYGIGAAMLTEFTQAATDENYYVYRVTGSLQSMPAEPTS